MKKQDEKDGDCFCSNNEKSHSVIDIAKEFVVLSNNEKVEVNILKIMKQLFFAKSLSLHFFDDPLFPECFEAWEKGPVVATVYSTWKNHKDSLLDTSSRRINDYEKFIIDMTFFVTKDFSAEKLSTMTHKQNGAWSQVFVPENFNIPISNDRIKKCFNSHTDILTKANAFIENQLKRERTLVTDDIKDLKFLNGN